LRGALPAVEPFAMPLLVLGTLGAGEGADMDVAVAVVVGGAVMVQKCVGGMVGGVAPRAMQQWDGWGVVRGGPS